MIERLTAEYWSTIKSFDTEEKLDLYLYRPVGFVIAKIGQFLKVTPTQVTVAGVIIGVVGGYLFSFRDSFPMLALGCFLFVMAGIFDSADGQLARLTKQYSKIGLVLDGIADNIVFISVYIFALLSVKQFYLDGSWYYVLSLGVVGGFCHSYQSAILDFYNREYIYFGYGKADYWNPSSAELAETIANETSRKERFFLKTRTTWIAQQQFLSTRTDEQRKIMKAQVSGVNSEKFQAMYRDHNRTMIRFWRLMGTNAHTIGICFFTLVFRRFDYYVIACDLIFMNIALLVVRYFQKIQDTKLLSKI